MGETDLHRDEMVIAIETLKAYFAGQQVYVSGNLLLFYRPGDRRRFVSPDVFVVRGLEPHLRDNYLLWEEGKPPGVVIEVTSASTKEEDLEEEYEIYRDEVKVPEYFLFDPRIEYLDPPLQGYQLVNGQYVSIAPIEGRLPSQTLGLHLEKVGTELRFYDPSVRRWLPTPEEAREKVKADLQAAEKARREAEKARKRAEAEVERLRREVERLRGGSSDT
jgi:Uma2 family endonuclease